LELASQSSPVPAQETSELALQHVEVVAGVALVAVETECAQVPALCLARNQAGRLRQALDGICGCVYSDPSCL
jgi:hypothetical protein